MFTRYPSDIGLYRNLSRKKIGYYCSGEMTAGRRQGPGTSLAGQIHGPWSRVRGWTMASTGGTGLGPPVEENPRTHVSSSILKRIRLYSPPPPLTIFSALFDFSVSWTVGPGGYGKAYGTF
jgi:hypothetical protein